MPNYIKLLIKNPKKQHSIFLLFRTLGIFFLFISLLLYRSFHNRPILGLWSYPFFTLIVFIFVLLLISIYRIIKELTTKKVECNSLRIGSLFLSFGIFSLGVSYLFATVQNSQNAARLADLNVFGSTVFLSAILDWIALALLTIGLMLLTIIKLQSKWRNIFLSLCSIIAILIIGEGFIRVKSILFPIPQGFPTYTNKIWLDRHIVTNIAGFRDIDHSVEKPLGTKRLLVVGDSFAYGWGVNQINNRFGEQLASRLTRMSSFEWESINASKGDTHTLHHINFLRECLKYEPDIIILLYVFNDIDYLRPVTDREDYNMLYSRINPIGILYRNSYLFQEAFLYLRLIKLRLKTNSNNASPYANQKLLYRHFIDITKFVKLAQESSAVVIVVPFDFDTRNNQIYNQFIATARDFDIPALPILTIFEKYTIQELRINKFDGHPNELAHSIAAYAVSNKITEFNSY